MNGGADAKTLATEDLAALEKGLPNLARHIANVRQFGVPVVVAVNRFPSDTDAELARVQAYATEKGARVGLSEVVVKGGAGGESLARTLLEVLAEKKSAYQPLYALDQSLKAKIETIATRVYGADGVDYTEQANADLAQAEEAGLGHLGVCIAKTQYSFTDNPKVFGAPTGFRITITGASPSAGAGFVVARAGDIMTMPGLSASPAAVRMKLLPDGTSVGLF